MDHLRPRQEAIRLGHRHYLGRPCGTCGCRKRYVLGSTCYDCNLRRSREEYARLREAVHGKAKP